MSEYFKENTKTYFSKIIFLVRSGTLDIKKWNSWKYDNNFCVMCDIKEENITHFLECSQYGKQVIEIEEIYTQNTENQFSIADKNLRKDVNKKTETRGRPRLPYSWLQSSDLVVEHYWNKIDR